jgi:hypothetical protein
MVAHFTHCLSIVYLSEIDGIYYDFIDFDCNLLMVYQWQSNLSVLIFYFG